MDMFLAGLVIGALLGVGFSILACRWAFKPEQGDGKTVFIRGTIHS